MNNQLVILIYLFFLTFSGACKKAENPADSFIFAKFRVEGNGCAAPCEVRFFNESSNAATYEWDFGNGQKSTEENPVIIFEEAGEYSVTLKATNANGNFQTASQGVNIEAEAVDLGFITGMDLSYQSFLDDHQTQFLDESGNVINDFFQYVKNNGVNLVRLRLFHSPLFTDQVVYSSRLSEVLDLCQRVKASGNNILLDFHYSDTWADPGKQFVPAAWDGKPFVEVRDSVYAYTKYVLEKLHAQNTLPEIIQIGNEINSGMLWDYGRVWDQFDNNWGSLVALFDAANQAISEIENTSGKHIQTMIHFAGINNATYFFDKLVEHNVTFDLIGLSFYTWWHGKDLTEIENSLQTIAQKYNKPILIVETSYPFTLEWNDWTDNVFGSSDHLASGYPATPQGQKAFFENLVNILKSLPNDTGKGFVWWAPDYVAFNGNQSTEGSAFENLCTFDFDNKALPVMEVFRTY